MDVLINNTFADGLFIPARIEESRFPIARGWQIECKSKADLPLLHLAGGELKEKPAGLNIRIDGSTHWIRLLQEIDPANIPFGQRCEVVLRGQSSSAEDRISWVALLCVRSDGKAVFHTRIFDHVSFQPDGSEVRKSLAIAPPAESQRYFFAFQLEGRVADLTLQSCLMHQLAAVESSRKDRACDPDEHPGTLSVGVVAWDMGHNPVGRAYLVADLHRLRHRVTLLGPSFPRYGTTLWAPIRDTDMPVLTFAAPDFRHFMREAFRIVKENPFDVVHVCKPRLPSLLIGMLYKLYWNIPVIVDVDDHELSFFNNAPRLDFNQLKSSVQPQDWEAPFTEIWTRFSDGLTELGDSVTVSNPTLRHLFGGRIVRHARDERVFDPGRYDRSATRSEFGLAEADKVILFLGTTRAYKGLNEVAAALETLRDPQAVLCVIGTIRDPQIRQSLAAYPHVRMVFHDDQPFSRVAELVNMADLVCLLQDPSHPASQYQIPAKLTDAMAMAVPVIATRVPPLMDLIEQGAIAGVDDTSFAPALAHLLTDARARYELGQRGRACYLSELAYAGNGVRAELSLKLAVLNNRAASPLHRELLAFIQEQLDQPIDPRDFVRMMNRHAAPARFHLRTRRPLNIAFFWKQNDSGIYGRRSDMVCKYLARHPKIGRIVHFDAPIGIKKLLANVQTGEDARFKQGNLVVANTIERFLKLRDDRQTQRRTFIYQDGGGESFLGQRLPLASDFPAFVADTLCRAGIGDHVIPWVCPVNLDYPAVHEELEFPFLVADVIDNHLAWDLQPSYAEKVRANYQYILSKASLVFANCEPVKRAMDPLHPGIHVIPNGAELFPARQQWPEPEALKGIPRPILGYVGNLSDRLRIPLLDRIAREHPDWSIVLIGSAHLKGDVMTLRKHPNVHLLGVIPYDQATAYIAHFDVALIPHEINAMTESMNPLKMYVYRSVGVPVVSTAVANTGDLGDQIAISTSDDAFIGDIQKTLERKTPPRRDLRRLKQISWPHRVNLMIEQIEQTL